MKQNIAWERLVAAARRAPEPGAAAPYGFATRVAARAFSTEPEHISLFGQFSLRLSLQALGAAALVATVATFANFSTLRAAWSGQTFQALPVETEAPAAARPDLGVPTAQPAAASPASSEDPVSDVLDMVS